MCGIVGIFDPKGRHCADATLRIINRMHETIAHRGPDDHGVFRDEASRLTLAHRRLSILDLSPAGHQPMLSLDERYALAFNGEIYNYMDLRAELRSHGVYNWRGHSDTEVILAAVSVWGWNDTLSRLNGMFAIALWDRVERRLYLARDRMGEKPLYYAIVDNQLLFSSELKALRAHPSFDDSVSPEAAALMLHFSYIPAPHTIYAHAQKLPAGNQAVFTASSSGEIMAEVEPYWRLPAPSDEIDNDEDATSQLEALLNDAVSIRMFADVPVGAFLSGGIDSSLVVALMQKGAHRPVRTFSIGFEEEKYNEAHHAKAVAQHLGTDHTELFVNAQQALDVIPALPHIYDEPLADSSQIPTYLLSSLTREHVTVALSGDGGDELFFGYQRYFDLMRKAGLWRMPQPLRRSLSAGLGKIGALTGNANLSRRAGYLKLPDANALYLKMIAYNTEDLLDPQVLGPARASLPFEDMHLKSQNPGVAEWITALDSLTYLPDDILVKVDRATMAASLEGRIPLLDHRIVEFSRRCALRVKFRGGRGKLSLRRILYKYVPPELIDRPKMGFGIPLSDWLRGPLKDWAHSLLTSQALSSTPYLSTAGVQRMWNEHITYRQDHSYKLWTVLTLQAWIEAQKTRQAT